MSAGLALLAALVAAVPLLWPSRRRLAPPVTARDRPDREGWSGSIRSGGGHPTDQAGSAGSAGSVGSTMAEVADALVLLALALRGGRSPIDAVEEVARRIGGEVGDDLATVAASHRWGLDAGEVWRAVPDVWAPASAAWVAAERAGVSPGPLLERAATTIRARAAAERESALQRSAVLLVLPLGVAFLPGFVLTTVMPTVWRLLPELLRG